MSAHNGGKSRWGIGLAWRKGHRAIYVDTPWFSFDLGVRPEDGAFIECGPAVVTLVPTEHKTNGAAPAMSPERRDALSAKDSPPGTDSGNQPGRIGSPDD